MHIINPQDVDVNPQSDAPPVPSPCIRHCTLNDEDVCVGCGRTLADITGWTKMSEIEKAVAMMAGAKRGIIYSGGGVINSGPEASEALRALAKATGWPVTSTLMGLGAFPASSPQWLGMVGMHGSFESNNAMHDCDVMLCVGARFDDRVTGRLDAFSPGSKKIHIDIDPSSINKNIRVDVPIIGDVANVLGIGYRVQGLFHILTGRWRPFVLAGVGGITTTTADRSIRQPDTTYSIPLGAGLKVDLTQYLGLRLDGRVLLQKGTPDGPALAPDGELTLGVFGRFGAARKAAAPSLPDRDRDGVADTVDLCPDLAGPPRRRGCPEASPALVPPPPVAPEPTTSVPLPALPPRPSAQ